jgi:AcrR family transcriptional regulator
MAPVAKAKLATKGQRTRQAFKAAVVDLIHEKSLAEVKVGDLCERTGLSVGAFYFHFRGRDDALEQTAIEILDAFFAGVLSAPAGEDLFGEIVDLLSGFHRGYVEQRLEIRAVLVILGAHRPVRQAWLASRLRLVERMVCTFARVRPASPGAFQSDYVLAQYLLSALERFYEEALFTPSYPRLHEEAASFEVFVLQQARLWHRAVVGHDPVDPKTEWNSFFIDRP